MYFFLLSLFFFLSFLGGGGWGGVVVAVENVLTGGNHSMTTYPVLLPHFRLPKARTTVPGDYSAWYDYIVVMDT